MKVTPSFCFAFKIPDDPTATSMYVYYSQIQPILSSFITSTISNIQLATVFKHAPRFQIRTLILILVRVLIGLI